MDKYLNIIKILEQAEITEEDEQFLQESSDEDIDIKYFIEIYLKLEHVLESTSHLDFEILSEFILYYDGDMEAATYIPYITELIEDHLTTCSKCNQEYIKLNKDFEQLDDYLSRSITTKNENEYEYEKEPSIFSRLKLTNFKTAITAFMLLLVTYVGMMLMSNYTTLPYKENIFLFKENYNEFIENRSAELFWKSINTLNQEEFETSVGYLTEDIIKHPNDSTIFYSRYLLGIAYLKSSENNILGTFTSYDHIRVGKGIENLLLAIKQNSNGQNEQLNIDAHYYIAKGYLAIDELDLAIEHLQIVVHEKGKYYSDSIKILKAIEDNREG